ncbi:MAG: hypothetical protein OXE53_04475 [Deltaproteobacteria bacterium]|nr:hypothetical protein [Deltaproteobacteria bacterium]
MTCARPGRTDRLHRPRQVPHGLTHVPGAAAPANLGLRPGDLIPGAVLDGALGHGDRLHDAHHSSAARKPASDNGSSGKSWRGVMPRRLIRC